MGRRSGTLRPTKEAAERELFVGREEAIAEFRGYLDSGADAPPPVVCYHGIGGQGKSALLGQLYGVCKAARIPCVRIDFDRSSSQGRYVNPETALLEIANGLAQTGLGPFFKGFLQVMSMLELRRTGRKWQPHDDSFLAQYGAPMVDMAGVVMGATGVGGVIPVAKAAWKIYSTLKGAGRDPQGLLSLEVEDLLQKLPLALAEDLGAPFKAACKRKKRRFLRPVIFLDTFEDLQTSNVVWGDRFIRDFAEHSIGTVLLVIGGRQRLYWDQASSMEERHVDDDVPWIEGENLLHVRLENLKTQECRSYLVQRAEVEEWELRDDLLDGLVRLTNGFPLHLGLATDFVAALARKQRTPLSIDQLHEAIWTDLPRPLHDRLADVLPPGSRDLLELHGETEEILADVLLSRLLREVRGEDGELIKYACVPRYLTEDVLQAVWRNKGGIRELRGRLTRYSFVDEIDDETDEKRWVIHSRVRELVLGSLKREEWVDDVHRRLADHLLEQSGKAPSPEARSHLKIEAVYHAVRADEETGVELFAEIAEEFSRLSMPDYRARLVTEVGEANLQRSASRDWLLYYRGRIKESSRQSDQAEDIYRSLAQAPQADGKTKAYSLASLSLLIAIRERGQSPQRLTEAEEAAKHSLSLGVPVDSNISRAYHALSIVGYLRRDWATARSWAAKYFECCDTSDDAATVISGCDAVMFGDAILGNWPGMIAVHTRARAALPQAALGTYLEVRVTIAHGYPRVYAGRYREVELDERRAWEIVRGLDEVNWYVFLSLALSLAFQNRQCETRALLVELSAAVAARPPSKADAATIRRVRSAIELRLGYAEEARNELSDIVSTCSSYIRSDAIGETLAWLGLACEAGGDHSAATGHYEASLAPTYRGRLYFECLALTGLVRAKYALGEYDAIPCHLAEAEALAQQYEYNDHLASLRLTQGHAAWNGVVPEWGTGFAAALEYYKRALVHALRYNRFMLDEVLWGGNICTPLKPIIPGCLERAAEGHQMLTAIRDWWQAGTNDVGVARPDTISLIPEGIPLVEAEATARHREPGDGSPQVTVLEKLGEAIGAA